MPFVSVVVGYFMIQLVILGVLLVLSYLVWDKRFKKTDGNKIPPGFEKTKEVTIDPTTGDKMRVYYNPRSGKRLYKKEEKF